MNDARVVFDNYQEIVSLHKKSVSPSEIAKQFNVRPLVVYQLLASLGMMKHVEESKEVVCVTCRHTFLHRSYTQAHALCPACKTSAQQSYRGLHTKEAKQLYIRALIDDNSSTALICDLTGLNRTSIWRIQKKLGLNKSSMGCIDTSCSTCGKSIIRPIHKVMGAKSFCDKDCYRAWLKAHSKYECDGYGSRISRMKVEIYFHLLDGMIVHHIDGNGLNTDIDNLMVFENQGDHIKFHRMIPGIKPIWDGRLIVT